MNMTRVLNHLTYFKMTLLKLFFLVDTGAPSGTIYLTEIQNKARGTKDHKWDALNRGNLYLSIVIHRPAPVTENVGTSVYHYI